MREKMAMRSFWAAFKFLTASSSPNRVAIPAREIAQSTPFFPLVGFCLGLILVLLNRILEPYLESEILGVVLVALLMLVTRAQHLEGLRETFDGISLAGDGEGAKGSRIGIFGMLAVLVVLMLKFRAIEVMGEARNQGLLLAPLFGRWAMVVLAYGYRPKEEGAGQIMLERVRGSQLFWATVLALVLVIPFAGRLGLWIALWVSLLTLLSGLALHRRMGGVSRDDFAAMAEVGEAFALVLFASP